MSVKSYLNFDLLLNEAGDSYQVHVDSPAGQTSHPFTLPFSELELENFILKIGQNRSGVRSLGLERVDMPSVKKLGGDLYDSLFGGDVSKLFYTSLAIAEGDGRGLRIRLRLSGASNLINIPWELLFDPASSDYLGLSASTPIIRKLDLARQPRVRPAAEVLRVLVMISSPAGFYPLNVEEEWERINTATQSLQAEGRLILERVKPSLDELQQRLGRGEYHIFHYVGHGGFDSQSNDGVLVLENDENKGKFVSGQDLGALLRDEITLQLVLLNSCNGGRTSVRYPFAGVGQSLLQKGIPAVIAMQFEITDDAAIAFSHAFYSVLADGYPIDTAVAEARKRIFAKGNPLEWATPVLYTSIDSGSLLREPTPEELQHLEEQRRQREEAKRQAELKRQEEEKQQSDLKRKEEKEQANQVEPETQPDFLPELAPVPKPDQPLPLEPQALLEQMPTPIQESSNTRLWVAGFAAFAIMIGTVLYWKQDGNEPTTTPVRASTQTAIVAPKPEASKRYQLSIKATPETATITVDGKTYEPGKEWEPGTYTVKAVADGYKSTGQVVTIKDQNAEAVLELEKIRYALTVETTPADAHISFLGTNFDYKSGMLLPLGDYTLRVEADGYTPVERVVTIKDQNTEVSLELEKIRYALTVKTIPPDARISLPGTDLNYESGKLLPPGNYTVKVEADGYLSQEKAFSIVDDDEILSIELTPDILAIEPEMVSIPAGSFIMGCVKRRYDVEDDCNDNEKPSHKVTLNTFQMGKYEVTFDEWDACEKANGCPHAGDDGWGRGKRPVINISWDDITQKYIPWLNQKTGKTYRLPSEAEWECAARGGKDTAFPWGESLGGNQANCNGCGSQWDNEKTAPVGSFSVNGYDLYDTSGNVWEWVADCRNDSYQGAASDGAARDDCGAGGGRVVRGGSWSNIGRNVRSAVRAGGFPADRRSNLGFRLSLDR